MNSRARKQSQTRKANNNRESEAKERLEGPSILAAARQRDKELPDLLAPANINPQKGTKLESQDSSV